MYGKLLLLTLGFLVIAAGLLVARHQRAQITYEMMRAQREARVLQQEVWHAQTLAAQRTAPDHLRQRIALTDLELEPAALPSAATLHTSVADTATR